jgi:hypothetical protein
MLVGLLASTVNAQQAPCFLIANTYYEQIYCQLLAEDKADSLPGFNDFRRNDQVTQQLLLKRPARSIGIEIRPSKRGSTAVNTVALERRNRAATARYESLGPFGGGSLASCQLEGLVISCDEKHYYQQGNRKNNRLEEGALSSEYRLDLAAYRGQAGDSEAEQRYLIASYASYIDKMLAIGLGGSTFTFGRFSFIYDDLQGRDVSFTERFETMFGYLKRDKRSMGINELVQPAPGIVLDDCGLLNNQLVVCSSGGNNYVYQQR